MLLPRHCALLGLAVTLDAAAAAAQTPRWGRASEPVVQAMIAMEDSWVQSNCAAQPGLATVFADEFQGTGPSGRRFGKAQAVATDSSDLHQDCRMGEVRIRFYGATIAIAFGSESGVRRDATGAAKRQCMTWTDTWLRRRGRWQIVAAQDTYTRV